MMTNTVCRWLCSLSYLTCSPINLNSESPEDWLKIGCVKVPVQLPPGSAAAGSILMHPGSSSEISLRKVTRKITNNTLDRVRAASSSAWIVHTFCEGEVVLSKWIWLSVEDCCGALRLSHEKSQLVYVVLNQLFFGASLVFL